MVSHGKRYKYYNLHGTYIVYSMSQCHPGTILSILLVTRTQFKNLIHGFFGLSKQKLAFFSVYLPSLPADHLFNAPRIRLVVTEDSARI